MARSCAALLLGIGSRRCVSALRLSFAYRLGFASRRCFSAIASRRCFSLDVCVCHVYASSLLSSVCACVCVPRPRPWLWLSSCWHAHASVDPSRAPKKLGKHPLAPGIEQVRACGGSLGAAAPSFVAALSFAGAGVRESASWSSSAADGVGRKGQCRSIHSTAAPPRR